MTAATNDLHPNPNVGSAIAPAPAAVLKRPQLPPWLWDVLLAGLMTMLGALDIFKSDPPATGPQLTPTDRWAWLLRIACGLLLAGRRRYPTFTLVAAWLIAITLALGNYQLGVTIFILWIALYTVGSHASTRRLVAGGIGSLFGMTIVAWTKPADLTATGAAWIGFMFTAAAVSGYIARRDRELLYIDLSERESTAEAATRRALLDITAERLRIADELSNVITRSIYTITQHAGTGSQLVRTDPAAARKILEAISTISRDALNDLRRLLKRIRTETEPAVYRPVTSAPSLVTTGDTP